MLSEKHLVVSEEMLRRVVRDSVRDEFKAVGLNAEDPIEVQKDMAYLRSWRTMVQQGGMKAFLSAVKFITIGLIAATLIGLGTPAKLLSLFGVR